MLVMVIAGEWYENEVVWGATAAVAAVAALVVAVLTYRAQFPRQRLEYWLRSATPLLRAPDGVRSDLELRRKGQLLEHPYIAEVTLAGRGRRDISSSAFDGGTPLRLDLGAPIVELLQVGEDPSTSTPMPRVVVDGTAVMVGPDLIGRSQQITISVLLENEPTLTCRSPLLDVPVRQDTLAGRLVRMRRLSVGLAITSLGMVLPAVALAVGGEKRYAVLATVALGVAVLGLSGLVVMMTSGVPHHHEVTRRKQDR